MTALPTGRDVLDVLLSVKPIEWSKYHPIQTFDDLRVPPIIVWRFCQDDAVMRRRIHDAVASFSGATEWTTYRGSRNDVMLPSRLREYLLRNEYRLDMDVIRDFGEQFAELVIAANRDLPALAEHLAKALQDVTQDGT